MATRTTPTLAKIVIATITIAVFPARDLAAQAPAVTIAGHIRDRNGAPAAGVSFQIRPYSGRSGTARAGITAADGAYSIQVGDTATVYDLYVNSTGWIPSSTTCRRGASDVRVVCDFVIRPTTPVFTAAPNEPRPVVLDRAKLGPADAIEIIVPRGRIFVASSWEDSVHVSYQLRRDVSGPRRDSMLVLPPYDGKIDVGFGAAGMQLRVNAADLSGNDGVDVRVTIPRKLKLVKISMLQSGDIGVEDFEGELVIKSEGGAVHLGKINGPTLVEARAGDITATIASTIAQQPVSLLTRKGDVQLILAAGWGAAFDIDTRDGVIMSRPALDGSSPIAPAGVMVVGNGPHHASGRFGVDGPLFHIVTLKGFVTVQQWTGPNEMPRWIGKP